MCFNRRHHCPHKQSSELFEKIHGPCNLSEYGQKYKWTDGKPRETLRPAPKALTSDAPMECSTINRLDFKPHEVKVPPPKQKSSYAKPDGKIEKDSEYRLKYTGDIVPPPKAIRPPNTKAVDESPFNARSTQQTDFPNWGNPKPNRYNEQRVYSPPKEKFQGKSTVQADYISRGRMSPTQSMKPAPVVLSSSEPFQSYSNYKADFHVHPIPPKHIQEREVYQPSKDGFKGTSTFTADFKAHYGTMPPQSLKPAPTSLKSNEPFNAKTVQSSDFQPWETQARQKRPPTKYNPPIEKFQAKSCFADDFKHYGPVSPSKSLKPPQKPVASDKPFEGTTIKSVDFKSWPLDARAKPIRHEKDYQPPTQTFNGTSTMQLSFKGAYGPPANSAKPEQQASQGSGKLDGKSVYRDSFTPKHNDPCPTTFFKPDNMDSTSRYLYSHQDKTGHKFFAPLSEITKAALQTATGQA